MARIQRERQETATDLTWEYLDRHPYTRRIKEGMPPVIITCAVTGEHQKSQNPNVPATAEEQAADAAAVCAAGASIIHIHGREAEDPTKTSADAARYYKINAMMRARAPEIIIDNTQTADELPVAGGYVAGSLRYYKSAPLEAKPEIMALTPGPMTFRGGHEAEYGGAKSSVLITSFDDTLRTAIALRKHRIKPQVFLYHPGHLDLLDYLIRELSVGMSSVRPTAP